MSGKVKIEIPLDVFLAEQQLLRSALNSAAHPDHGNARAELKRDADAYREVLGRHES